MGRGSTSSLTPARSTSSFAKPASGPPTPSWRSDPSPGTSRTLRLIEAARSVVAVEIDRRMVDVVNTRVLDNSLAHRFTVICEDGLKTKFPEFDLCVANIPYGISSPLVVKFLYGGFAFRGATLLLQKEFARRLLPKPGDSAYNWLAVNANLAATVKHVIVVSKRDFVPCLKVDSSVVNSEPTREVLDVDLEEWRAFVRACNSKKNKTLGATFKQKSRVRDLLKMATSEPTGRREEEDYDDMRMRSRKKKEMMLQRCVLTDNLVATLREDGFEGKRPSTMSIEEHLHLLALFNKAGIHFHHQL